MSRKISEFYKNKNILVTGATGFLGLGFIEKILRAFPDVGNIFMIVRSRRGETLAQRKESFINNQVFERIKRESPTRDIASKLVWIEGDLRKPDLGLSRASIRDLQQAVNMIIHSAATVKFVAPLKDAITMNVSATNDLLNIAAGCKNFDCFVHISTIYCKALKTANHIDEELLRHPIDPLELITLANAYDRNALNAKTPELISGWPNTYTYTKNAAENLLASWRDHFPIAIYRPGVVVHSYAEPSPFWIGNNMAFARIMMEAGRGRTLTSIDAAPHVNGNLVPVDMTINGMLMAAYRTAMEDKFNIYNYTTNNNPYPYVNAFADFAHAIKDYKAVLIPLREKLLRLRNVPAGSYEEKLLQEMKIYEQFHETAVYFMRTHFTYATDNIDRLWASMNDEEQRLLPFDLRQIDWKLFYGQLFDKGHGTSKIIFDRKRLTTENLI